MGIVCYRVKKTLFIPGNGLAFFLLNSSALPLLDVIALLFWNISALLGDNITTNLSIGSLLADLSFHWVTLLAIDCLAFLTRNILKGQIKFRLELKVIILRDKIV